MGTTYFIKAYIPRWYSQANLTDSIDNIFFTFNKSFSLYDDDSEINKFNSMGSEPHIFSKKFIYLLNMSSALHKKTNAYFDPSFKLGKFKVDTNSTYMDLIEFISQNEIRKLNPKLSLDFNAIAKGYAIDVIRDAFISKRISSFFIEIGGEVYAAGRKPNKELWK